MAGGVLVKVWGLGGFVRSPNDGLQMLLHTDVTKYLEFKVVEGSYVYKKGSVHKVPATEKEALSSSLMGIMEKRRFKKMLEFVAQYEESNPKTHGKFDMKKATMKDVRFCRKAS